MINILNHEFNELDVSYASQHINGYIFENTKRQVHIMHGFKMFISAVCAISIKNVSFQDLSGEADGTKYIPDDAYLPLKSRSSSCLVC